MSRPKTLEVARRELHVAWTTLLGLILLDIITILDKVLIALTWIRRIAKKTLDIYRQV